MNFKKKLAALVTTAACALSCIGIGGVKLNDETVNAAGLSGKTAFEITADMKVGWNLGNTLDAYDASKTDPKGSVTSWGNPEPNQGLFDAVKKAGFNTVRIPTTWFTHLNGDSVDGQWMNYVKNTVDMALKSGLYVILNIHHENFINVDQFTEQTKANAESKMKTIWTAVANTFKDYDQHLIFEGMNEPRQVNNPNVEQWGAGDDYSHQYVNYLNKVFVNIIRNQGSAANKERLLMLPDYVASSDPTAVSSIEVPAGDNHIALSVHAYLPYFFTMATDDKANHHYDANATDGYGNNFKQNIESFFSSMKSISQQKNAPIIIGEFGSSDFGNTEDRVRWTHDYMTNAKNAGVVCVLWDNNIPRSGAGDGENHNYLNRNTNQWYDVAQPIIKEMMNVVGQASDTPVYVHKDFNWNDIQVGSNWVELFKSNEGVNPTSDTDDTPGWGPYEVKKAVQYINKGYKICIVADSTGADPALVVMTEACGKGGDESGWYYVTPDGTSKQDYVFFYDYSDMEKAAKGKGSDSIANLASVFASEHNAEIKLYGVYAIPTGEVVETQPTQPVVTTTTTTTTVYTQPTQPTQPTTTQSQTQPTITQPVVNTTPAPTPSTQDGVYEANVSKKIVYSELPTDDKMIGFAWKQFGVKSGEYATKIEFKLSAGKDLGKWVGAFGSSTTVSPDYWTMTADMEQALSGSSATLTWEPDAATAKTFAYQGGDLKFGVWWIDCGEFTIDSIKVYTAKGSSTPTPTPAVTTTVQQPTPSVTTTTTANTPSSQDGAYEAKVNKKIVYSELPTDDKMIGFAWKQFGIKSGDYATKIEFNLSAGKDLGKWVGAFGSSTTVSPDYWTMTADMEKSLSGSSATLTWEPDAATAKTFAYQGGDLKFGVWWIDCGEFTIDSIKVYTANGGSTPAPVVTTTTTSKAPVVITTTTTTAVITQPTQTTTQYVQPTTQPTVQPSGKVTVLGDVDLDGTVGVSDITALCKYLLNSQLYDFINDTARANADVTRDGQINIMDVSKIIEFNLGKIRTM